MAWGLGKEKGSGIISHHSDTVEGRLPSLIRDLLPFLNGSPTHLQ